MSDVTRIAIGTGSVEKDSADRIQRGWERLAHQGPRVRAIKATPQDLAAFGIGYERVPTTTN